MHDVVYYYKITFVVLYFLRQFETLTRIYIIDTVIMNWMDHD